MDLQPIYNRENLSASYKLRYAWCGWPSSGLFPDRPLDGDDFWKQLDDAWKTDGLHRLEGVWNSDSIRFTFSVVPSVSPVLFTARVKGRLQHAMRMRGCPVKFSRKVSFRTIGDNHRRDVEAYIEKQVQKEPCADPNFQRLLEQFTVINRDVDLSQPTETNSGRYWYNLHLVLVTQNRHRIVQPERLGNVRDLCLRISAKKSNLVSRLSVVPDHLHMSMRGNIEHAPEDIALAYLNNLAYGMGRNAIWQYGYYAGTFGEYDMGAVRR